MQGQHITGRGVEVVTHLPCPGCAAPNWLDFPITAALNDYADVQQPSTCKECGRTFQMLIEVQGGGPSAGGSTEARIVQTGGDDIPDYLPPIERRLGSLDAGLASFPVALG